MWLRHGVSWFPVPRSPGLIVSRVNRLRLLLGSTRGRLLAAVAVVVLALAVVLAVVLPGGGEQAASPAPSPSTTASSAAATSSPPAEPAAVYAFPTTVATALVEQVDVYEQPSTDAGPVRTLDAADELSGQLTFVVVEQRGDWLDVQLPARPNGATGWVQAEDVSLSAHDYSIEVRLTEHRMLVRKADAVVLDTPIGVGASDAPTPGGRYYLKELLQPPDPSGGYGPYAYGLSGFSDVFTTYSGGDGVIGIHGTDQPETVGSDVSDGCIRVTNEVVTQLVDQVGLPLGTPVTIVA